MKKSSVIILLIFSIIISAGIGSGVTYILLNKKTDDKIGKIEEKIQQIEEKDETKSTIKNTNSTNTYNTNNEQKTKTRRYTHVALQGCVITESNSKTGYVVYKKKCETCGTVQSGTTGSYLTGGILNSSFYCPKCKKTQSIKIETNSYYE